MQVVVLVHTSAETAVELIIDVSVTTEVVRRHKIPAEEIDTQVCPELKHVLVRSINSM